MKKLLLVFFALVALFALTSCGTKTVETEKERLEKKGFRVGDYSFTYEGLTGALTATNGDYYVIELVFENSDSAKAFSDNERAQAAFTLIGYKMYRSGNVVMFGNEESIKRAK